MGVLNFEFPKKLMEKLMQKNSTSLLIGLFLFSWFAFIFFDQFLHQFFHQFLFSVSSKIGADGKLKLMEKLMEK